MNNYFKKKKMIQELKGLAIKYDICIMTSKQKVTVAPDSAEKWAKTLEFLLSYYPEFEKRGIVRFDLSNIRPKGDKIEKA